MAFTENQIAYAYYVVATVESGCNYGAVNQVDAITLGIVQLYGQNAYRLLKRIKDEAPDAYDKLSERLKGLASGGEKTWDYWTNIYVQNNDAESWVESSKLDSNRKCQDKQAILDMFGSDGNSGRYGATTAAGDNPKSRIFLMSMYHQNPSQANNCMSQLPPNSSIDTIRQWCFSNRVFASYRNRYNKVYELLNGWDGESAPPDFGQSDDLLPNDPSGQAEDNNLSSTVGYIQKVGDDLIIHGDMSSTSTLLCRNTGRGIWVPVSGTNADNPGGGSGGGNTYPPASPDDPADFPAMRKLWYDNANKWSYAQAAGRLDPPSSGYSDCSACIYWAANAATNGKYSWIGTWTGAMVANCPHVLELDRSTGFTIDKSLLRPGDLIIMDYATDSDVESDHVDWYMGNGVVWGAGSAPLPHHITDDITNLYNNYGLPIQKLWVCRFLD